MNDFPMVPDDQKHPDHPPQLTFAEQPIRFVLVNGTPWLCATDACRALRLDVTYGSRQWLTKLDARDRSWHPMPTNGGLQRMASISPQGALALAMQRNRRVDRSFASFLRQEDFPMIIQREAVPAPMPMAVGLAHLAPSGPPTPSVLPALLRALADELEQRCPISSIAWTSPE
jgi:hypothetical protein